MSKLTLFAAAAAAAIAPFTSIGMATAADLNGTKVSEIAANQRFGNPVQIAQRRICLNRRCKTRPQRFPGYNPTIRPKPVRDTTPPTISMTFYLSGISGHVTENVGPTVRLIPRTARRVTVRALAKDFQSKIKVVSIVGKLHVFCVRKPRRQPTVDVGNVYRSPVRYFWTAQPTARTSIVIPTAQALRCPDGSTPTRAIYELKAHAQNYSGQWVHSLRLTISMI